ncbi:MAG: spore cortex biosynthesis protein YabQ [Ruminococcus sp.]|nr:spore cortex biosynthesis protein YabQ [Ruminococcus sp.]
MEYTFAEQSIAFLYSILLGACLSLVYIPLKIIRLTLKPKKINVIILDVLFMLISAFATFLYALAFLNGSVRFYMILGEAIGFILFQMSAGKIILKIAIPGIKFLIINIKKILNFLKKIIKKLLKIFYKVLYNVVEKIRKFVDFFKKYKKEKRLKKPKKKLKKGNDHGSKKQIRKKQRSSVPKKHKRSKTV